MRNKLEKKNVRPWNKGPSGFELIRLEMKLLSLADEEWGKCDLDMRRKREAIASCLKVVPVKTQAVQQHLLKPR